jgi:RNA polymerase primary sigma factor
LSSTRSPTGTAPPDRLPAEAERALVAAAESGDAQARAKLVETFWPSIAGVARVYQASSAVNRDELMQEGVVGLLRAAGRFDPEMGTPFWAYATWWVRQAMQQLVAEVTRPVVLSDRAFRRLARIKDARSQFVRERGEEPTTDDLVEATELTRVQIENLMVAERPPRGFEEPLGGEESATATLGETVADPTAEDAYEHVIEGIEIEELRNLTKGLADRERAIIFAHYGLGQPAETLREIAEGLDLSVERVRQIEERALERLREAVIEGEAAVPPAPPSPAPD